MAPRSTTIAICAACTLALLASAGSAGGGTKLLFDAWRSEHRKRYATAAELERRWGIFQDNVAYINAHNARGDSSVVLATNQFSDLTREEFRAAYLGRLHTEHVSPAGAAPSGTESEDADDAAPVAVDWVRRNGTTPVKNQGPCGGCWAFSATGALEGMEFVAGGGTAGPASLSEQQLLACTVNKDYSEGGCGGGTMSSAFKYAKDKGLCGEDEMPFTAWNTTITNTSCSGTVGGEVPTCTPVLKPGLVDKVVTVAASEQGLAAAVQIQPVSIGIEADHPEFQHYGGGVFKDMGCGTKLDHGVLLVGYGQEGNQTCDPATPGSRVCSTTQTCCKDAPGGDHVWGCCPLEDAKCCPAPKAGDSNNCCPSGQVCYNCPGPHCECVTMQELRALEFEAKMKGVTKEELGPIGRPAIPVQMRDTTAAVTPAQWEEEEEERRGSCTPADSIKTGLCMGGNTVKVAGSDKGQMLPSDCAKICEADTTCLGFSVVPSTVPAGLRQWQGCYTSNSSWDGGRVTCPYTGDASGCSSRGVAKYPTECCPAGPMDTKKYWYVKNSWGPNWGDKGFIKIMKDTGTSGGLCGVAMQASYPTAGGSGPAVMCNPHANPPETCPGGKPCPPSGKCPPSTAGAADGN